MCYNNDLTCHGHFPKVALSPPTILAPGKSRRPHTASRNRVLKDAATMSTGRRATEREVSVAHASCLVPSTCVLPCALHRSIHSSIHSLFLTVSPLWLPLLIGLCDWKLRLTLFMAKEGTKSFILLEVTCLQLHINLVLNLLDIGFRFVSKTYTNVY